MFSDVFSQINLMSFVDSATALLWLQEELAKHARHQMTAKEKRQQQAMLIDAWTEIGYFMWLWTNHFFAHHRHISNLDSIGMIDMDPYGGFKKPASASTSVKWYSFS